MYCPKCGTKNEFQQSYCRSCGIELEEVIQSLTKNEGLRLQNTEWLKKLGVFSLGILGALIFCLLSVAISSSLRINIGAALVIFMILFGIMFGILAVLLFDKYQGEKRKGLKKAEEDIFLTPQFERLNTNRQLQESKIAPIPSVIEETTELFQVEKLRPKTSGDLP